MFFHQCTNVGSAAAHNIGYNAFREATPIVRVCLAAVQQNGMALEFVLEPLHSSEICLAATRQNGMTLRFVERPNAEVCAAAVLTTPAALELVSETARTLDMCMGAVRRSVATFLHVPPSIQTADMCELAFRSCDLYTRICVFNHCRNQSPAMPASDRAASVATGTRAHPDA